MQKNNLTVIKNSLLIVSVSAVLLMSLIPILSESSTENWISPTGFEDPDREWRGGINAYDEDITSYTFTRTPPNSWSSFLILTLNNRIKSDQVRVFTIPGAYIDKIDIDVSEDGLVWVDAYEGFLNQNQWEIFTFPEHNVLMARVRFHNSHLSKSETTRLAEFDFEEVLAIITTLHTDPPSVVDSSLNPGDTFIVNVNVSDIANLYGYDFKLSYDTNILNVLNVTSGQFFSPNSLYCIKRVIENTEGYVRTACIPMDKKTGVNGSGNIETIVFQVVGTGESNLHFYDTILSEPNGKAIIRELNDGYFNNMPSTTTTTVPSECKPRGTRCNCNGICDGKETSDTCPWDCS